MAIQRILLKTFRFLYFFCPEFNLFFFFDYNATLDSFLCYCFRGADIENCVRYYKILENYYRIFIIFYVYNRRKTLFSLLLSFFLSLFLSFVYLHNLIHKREKKEKEKKILLLTYYVFMLKYYLCHP